MPPTPVTDTQGIDPIDSRGVDKRGRIAQAHAAAARPATVEHGLPSVRENGTEIHQPRQVEGSAATVRQIALAEPRWTGEPAGLNRQRVASASAEMHVDRAAQAARGPATDVQESTLVATDTGKARSSSGLPGTPLPLAAVPASLTTVRPAQSPAAPIPVFTVDAPVLDPVWQSAVNDRVVWLAGRHVPSAEIRLNPAELGPLQVQVSVDDRSVNVSFTAAHALTREALEAALPRLKEMLLQNGMSLTGASVGDQGPSYRQAGSGETNDAFDGEPPDGSDATAGGAELLRPTASGGSQSLIDTYV